jgi:hypothetical protein
MHFISGQSHLLLSAYFLKYTTLAKYLEPRPTDVEIIEALQTHYTQEVQKLLLSIQNTINEAVEILRKLELIEKPT